MRTEQLVARLRATPQFEELDPGEVETLAAALEVIEAADGDVLIREGDRADGCYFLVDGRVRIRHEHPGATLRVDDLRPGTLFGLVGLIDHGRRSASCVAVGPTVVARLPAEAFNLLHDGSPALVLHFQRLVARQLARDVRALNRSLVGAMLAPPAAAPTPDAEPPQSLSGELHLSSGG